jgi:carbon starvation protein
MKNVLAKIFWVALSAAGAWAYATICLQRSEPLNSVFILIAAICTYAIGYRFYSKWIAARVLMLNDRRATPCEVQEDGKDFCKTNKWIVFGHHFAAISGPGPLVGPVLAAQFGYLPGTLWILIGVVLGGAVQDFIVLFASMRRNGKSLGQMVKEELNTTAGYIALVAILAIMVILLAVLALVVVKALAESPWGIFTVGATIPIALFMGGYLRFWRIGKVMEASVAGVILLLLAVWGGKLVHESERWSQFLGLTDIQLAWVILAYSLAASVLPVWLLLAPRDYLSTFMKLGTIIALAFGIVLLLPDLKIPALTQFVDGSGPVVAGKVFPFCFITIACGAISGFHTLIASGTTPKIISRESYARTIGYGAMCLESLVAIMALIAACTLDPGVYLTMNMKGEPAATVAKVNSVGYPITVERMEQLSQTMGEKTLFNRTAGAATLAVGMAGIFSNLTAGRWLDLWYHFAIMFEALFILTTLDAGTRVGRYILQDFLGNIYRPLGDTKNFSANVLASGLMVCSWGYFLIQGVRDPLGGINSLWPLFGIANQMLAAIALCLATTILLKMTLLRRAGAPATSDSQNRKQAAGSIDSGGSIPRRSPILILVTLIPLLWLLSVTFAAGIQKIWHPDPRIGFLAQADSLQQKLPALEKAVADASATSDMKVIEAAVKAFKANRTLRFNNRLDALIAGIFLFLVSIVFLLSVREWLLLWARKRVAELKETPPVWLPDYAVAESKPLNVVSLIALSFALAKELSGEAELERAHAASRLCDCARHQDNQTVAGSVAKSDGRIYVDMTEKRFNGVTRCC